MTQVKQREWHEQWSIYRCKEISLLEDWMYPRTLDDFRDKKVLEGGCGGGQHTGFIAPFAKEIVAVDLNTADLAKERNKDHSNITFVTADIAKMDLKEDFDVVFCIGVVHHTDFPDKTIANLMRHLKPGGLFIIWVYSKEGNFLVEYCVEPIRKIFLRHFNKKILAFCSNGITALLYIPVFTIYFLPIKFLPYYEYFQSFRRLSFHRNALNVFDKLNAPQVEFLPKKRIKEWFNENEFEDIQITPYLGVSWRASGRRKQ